MCRCAERVPDYEERDVGRVRILEDVVAAGLDEFAVGKKDSAAVEGFLGRLAFSTYCVESVPALAVGMKGGARLTSFSLSTSRIEV